MVKIEKLTSPSGEVVAVEIAVGESTYSVARDQNAFPGIRIGSYPILWRDNRWVEWRRELVLEWEDADE